MLEKENNRGKEKTKRKERRTKGEFFTVKFQKVVYFQAVW